MKAIKQKIHFDFRKLIKAQPRVQTRFMIRKLTKELCQSVNSKTGNVECTLCHRVNLTESDKNKSFSRSAPENL